MIISPSPCSGFRRKGAGRIKPLAMNYKAKTRYGGTASEKIAGSGDLLLLRIERKNFWFLIAWIKERIKNPR